MPIHKWVKKWNAIYTIAYYLAIESNEVLTHAAT